jgi:hypothetical protein
MESLSIDKGSICDSRESVDENNEVDGMEQTIVVFNSSSGSVSS